MPKSCLHCFCMRGCPAARRRQNKAEPMFPRTYRHDDCPLVEVPPHGKLIDADALKAWFVEWYDLNADLEIIHFLEILSDEDSAPTIIEAEE